MLDPRYLLEQGENHDLSGILDMKRTPSQIDLPKTALYYAFALMGVALVFYLFHFRPVIFTRLIAEDQWGEYGTSLSFAVAGGLFLLLSFRSNPWFQRGLFVMMGLIAIFVAGEEISWGQRIFHFETPPSFYQFNYQGEFNFHNFQTVASWKLHAIAAYLVTFWSLFSLAVSIWRPPLKEGIWRLWLPIIPVPLLMLFLCAPCFILLSPLPKSDEIGELFLGIASSMLALDLFLGHDGARRLRRFGAAVAAIAMVSSIGIISLILTRFFPLDMGWSLNRFAVQEYPSIGMYAQADQIYHYIYAHPRYLNSETRINHGKMLLRVGQKEEAFLILSQAFKEFEALNPEEAQQSKNLRRVGTIHALLGEVHEANAKFDRAVEVDEQRLEDASGAEEKAGVLWSLAKTLDARGDKSAAMERAKEARATAISPRIRRSIGIWIKRKEEKACRSSAEGMATPLSGVPRVKPAGSLSLVASFRGLLGLAKHDQAPQALS